MDSLVLTIRSASSSPPLTSNTTLKPPMSLYSPSCLHISSSRSRIKSKVRVRVSASITPPNGTGDSSRTSVLHKLKSAAGAIILAAAAAASVAGKFQPLPARAGTPTALTEEILADDVQNHQREEDLSVSSSSSSPLTQFLESNSEAIEALKSLLQQKLVVGEDAEALMLLEKLVSAQPEQTEWKFLMARLFNEMGKIQEARDLFEDILKLNPLSFEALFENALLMDRCGEGEAVITRLEEALKIAENEKKAKEARDVRLIMAQIQFLQKNIDEALRSYQELSEEEPSDFRPYFCKGMIYSLLDRNKEAREEFAKYRELSPKKFEVEGYLRSPLSRMKLFGTNEEN